MQKFKFFLKNNWTICLIVLISIILHFFALKELGVNYTLQSDDLSYINSGITFFETGIITMHDGLPSAQIMPGMSFLIALFCLIFGTGSTLFFALKIFWIFMGIFTIIGVYKCIRLYTNQYCASIPCLFFLSLDYIWINNVILTETPYILLFVFLVYHTLKLGIKANTKDYVCIVIYYIMAIFIRPNIVIYPFFLIGYLLLKKYNIKLLIKQIILAGEILALCLIPWTYRNYKLFNEFIPLTYGIGNPLLLGTYQGYNYPFDSELDYKSNVYDKLSQKIKIHISNPLSEDYLSRYYRLKVDEKKARYRMQEWWKKDKISMIKSYLLYKPNNMLFKVFYWDNIFDIEIKYVQYIRIIEIMLFLICFISIVIDRRKIKEWIFLMMVYISQLAIYSYTFSYSRYGVSFSFIRYIIIGLGISVISQKIIKCVKKWRCK